MHTIVIRFKIIFLKTLNVMFWNLLVYPQGVHELFLYKELLNTILTSYICGRACGILAYRLNMYSGQNCYT